MIDAYKSLWIRAFDFSGRSNRGDYWWAVLANFIVAIIFSILSSAAEAFLSLYYLYTFATLIPGLSLVIRRVRDAGKGWQWIFINLIPIVGAIWFLVILCQPSIPVA